MRFIFVARRSTGFQPVQTRKREAHPEFLIFKKTLAFSVPFVILMLM